VFVYVCLSKINSINNSGWCSASSLYYLEMRRRTVVRVPSIVRFLHFRDADAAEEYKTISVICKLELKSYAIVPRIALSQLEIIISYVYTFIKKLALLESLLKITTCKITSRCKITIKIKITQHFCDVTRVADVYHERLLPPSLSETWRNNRV